MENPLKKLWQSGGKAINCWLASGNAHVAELMAEADYDSLTIDVQHGLLDYTHVPQLLQAIRTSGKTPLVRVPWLDKGMIMKVLDAGAMGVICPMINNAEEAREFASAMRYPPRGERSFGPTRARTVYGSDYAERANDEIIAFAMIETADGLANVEEIAAVDGIDAFFIGPADLTLGVTQGRLRPGFDREEEEMLEAIHKILQTAKKHHKRAGLYCGSAAYAAKAFDWGFDLATVGNDLSLVKTAADAMVGEARALMGQEVKKQQAGGGY